MAGQIRPCHEPVCSDFVAGLAGLLIESCHFVVEDFQSGLSRFDEFVAFLLDVLVREGGRIEIVLEDRLFQLIIAVLRHSLFHVGKQGEPRYRIMARCNNDRRLLIR